MKDGLKDYVDNKRQEFELPAEGLDNLWEGIAAGIEQDNRQQQPKDARFNWRPVMKIAAALLVGVSLVAIALQYTNKPNTQAGEVALGEISNELAETSEYYASQIETKIEFIKTSRSEVDPAIWEDLELLDQAFIELKDDLRDNADNEEVVNAMIQNYRIKLEILEHIIDELQSDEEGN